MLALKGTKECLSHGKYLKKRSGSWFYLLSRLGYKMRFNNKGKKTLGKFKSDGVVGIFNGNASKGFFLKKEWY